MPRFVISCSPAPRGACLILAVWLLGAAPALAQVAGAFDDPLSPQLNDGRTPSTFQRVDAAAQAQSDQPTTFTPPPSGAGLTGFDASNSPNRAPPPRRPVIDPAADTAADAGAAAAPTSAQPPPPKPSPYQQPIPPLPGDEALAAAPAGGPPVALGPIRKPKTRKAHSDEPTDPYEPTGVHAGSFLLYSSVDLIGGYNTNPGASPGGSGATVYSAAPEIQVQSLWSRHELKADLRGSYTGYSPDESPTLSRPYFDGKIDGRIDVRHDTHVLLGTRALVSTDNPGSPNLQAGLSKLPVFVTYGGSAGLRQSFNRFEVTATGDAQRTAYQDSILTDGTTISNADRNYDQIGGKLRGSYETLPGVKPFVQIEADKRKHDTEFDENGFARDSNGWTGLIGTTFALKRDLTGEVAIGYTRRVYQDARLDPLAGIVGDASLIWTVDALNTVKASVASTAAESTLAGVSGVLSRDFGLQLDHAFRRWLIGTVKLGFGWDVYQGSSTATSGTSSTALCDCVVSTPGGTTADRVDKRYTAGLGITYKVDRTTWIKGEFRQDWLRSNVTGVDYNASTVLFGLRLQQ